ncbi:MAG: nucleotidyltransferase family protein, partial [Pseudomonadota bacterium]
SRDNPEIAFSDEAARLLETGGGVRKALPLLGPDPFITINSDAVWKGHNPIAHLLSAWQSDRMDALMLLVPRERAVAYTRQGDFFLAGMTPSRRGSADKAPFVYTGCQIIRPTAFDDAPLGPFSTNLIWDRLISAKRLAAIVYDGAWVDVGTPDGLDEANRLLGGPE